MSTTPSFGPCDKPTATVLAVIKAFDIQKKSTTESHRVEILLRGELESKSDDNIQNKTQQISKQSCCHFEAIEEGGLATEKTCCSLAAKNTRPPPALPTFSAGRQAGTTANMSYVVTCSSLSPTRARGPFASLSPSHSLGELGSVRPQVATCVPSPNPPR